VSTMQDCELEQLSRLFARGSLSNAHEISRLLRTELGEQAELSNRRRFAIRLRAAARSIARRMIVSRRLHRMNYRARHTRQRTVFDLQFRLSY